MLRSLSWDESAAAAAAAAALRGERRVGCGFGGLVGIVAGFFGVLGDSLVSNVLSFLGCRIGLSAIVSSRSSCA